MRGRTVREFTYRGDLWPLVDSWAAETGFTPVQKDDSGRSYRRRRPLFMAPAFVEIRREGRKVIVSAWVKADFFLILNLLTGEKPEAGIASGGLTAAIPRKRARESVNLLLRKLGQQPIP